MGDIMDAAAAAPPHDKDASEELDIEEVISGMKEMNIGMPEKDVQVLWPMLTEQTSGSLAINCKNWVRLIEDEQRSGELRVVGLREVPVQRPADALALFSPPWPFRRCLACRRPRRSPSSCNLTSPRSSCRRHSRGSIHSGGRA